MRKCKYVKGCKNEAVWAMQFIASPKPSFYAFGWHIRGFGFTPICDEHFEIENARQQRLLLEEYSITEDDLPFGGWAPNEADLEMMKPANTRLQTDETVRVCSRCGTTNTKESVDCYQCGNRLAAKAYC